MSEQMDEVALNEATTLHQRGMLDAAIARYVALRKRFPEDAKLAFLHGTALLQHNQLNAALEALERCLQLNPALASAHNNLGMVHMRQEHWADAIVCFERALAIKPQHADALLNAGIAARKLSRLSEALAFFKQLADVSPECFDLWVNMGLLCKQMAQTEQALLCFEKALCLQPTLAYLHHNRGLLLMDLKRLPEALASVDEALRLSPTEADFWNSRGLVFKRLNRFEDALASYQQALQQQPDHADTLKNKGVLLAEIGQTNAALECFDAALLVQPAYADAWNNKGIVLVTHGEFSSALRCYDQAIALKPDFADAYWNKSILLILLGEYRQGWDLYEWRCQKDDTKAMYPVRAGLDWRGQTDLRQHTLLVTYEQGYGDVVQFCRYLPLLVAQGIRVVFYVQKALKTLMQQSLGESVLVIAKGEPLPSFDAYCPLMSLPKVFGTTVETIPKQHPYLFAQAHGVAQWQNMLQHDALAWQPPLRVGIVWSGSTIHKDDANRSIVLSRLAALLTCSVEWHCLQKEIRPDDRDLLEQYPQVQLHNARIADFADTAALIACMDLVISVDTSVAHLAGALAKPVWILLPHNPDYRWLTEREDCPWYPTATLFRQPVAGDWESVLANVKARLMTILNNHQANLKH